MQDAQVERVAYSNRQIIHVASSELRQILCARGTKTKIDMPNLLRSSFSKFQLIGGNGRVDLHQQHGLAVLVAISWSRNPCRPNPGPRIPPLRR